MKRSDIAIVFAWLAGLIVGFSLDPHGSFWRGFAIGATCGFLIVLPLQSFARAK